MWGGMVEWLRVDVLGTTITLSLNYPSQSVLARRRRIDCENTRRAIFVGNLGLSFW